MAEKQTGSSPEYKLLSPSMLIPTPDNPRGKVNEKSIAFQELLESVKRDGIKIPVHARPHPTQKGKFDLRVGARRHKAAQVAKLELMPVLVYDSMSDAEAYDYTCIENLHRDDLPPLAQSKATAGLLEKHNNDYKVVADKIGRTEHWVRVRSNVDKCLSTKWKKEAEKEDSPFQDWTISHYELIARFDSSTQDRLLKEFTVGDMKYRRPRELKELGRLCNEITRLLKNARWGLDAVLEDGGKKLPKCQTCKKRSGCQPLLFDEKPESEKDDKCLDAVCWTQKTACVIRQNIEKQKVKHPNLVLLSNDGDYKERSEIAKALELEIESNYSFTPCKQSDKNAIPCYVVCGKSAGRVLWRKPAYSGSSSSTAAKKKEQKTLAEKRQELERKRWFYVLNQLAEAVDQSNVDQLVFENKPLAVMALISQFGTEPSFYQCSRNFVTLNERLSPKAAKDAIESLPADLFRMVKPRLIETFFYNGPVTQTPDDNVECAKNVADLLGIDLSDLFDEAVDQHKEPKSWAKLDGSK